MAWPKGKPRKQQATKRASADTGGKAVRNLPGFYPTDTDIKAVISSVKCEMNKVENEAFEAAAGSPPSTVSAIDAVELPYDVPNKLLDNLGNTASRYPIDEPIPPRIKQDLINLRRQLRPLLEYIEMVLRRAGLKF